MNAQTYTGDYSTNTPEGVVTASLLQDDTGMVNGRFAVDDYVMQVSGWFDGTQVTGTLASNIETLGFVAKQQEENLLFTLVRFDSWGQPDYNSAQTLVLAKGIGADSANPQLRGNKIAVAINGVELSDKELHRIESEYGTKIPTGRYWYDSECGAWGIEGGPTVGFIPAGLTLPGPMPADVSGGGTNIYINGREIHLQDQIALVALLGGTIPGRYSVDAKGNLSVEGGAFIVNLVQASQSQQQSSGKGGLYSGMGGTVGTDGSGGVLFYSKNASGGYTTWNN